MDKNEARALQLHKKSIVIDALTFSAAISGHQDWFDDAIKAGVTAAVMTVPEERDPPLQVMKRFKIWYELFDELKDKIILVSSTKDIETAKKEGKFGVILASQNAAMLGEDLDLLPAFKKLGFRIIQPTYQIQNLLGEGCGERTNSGLSLFGVEFVKEMNRLHLLLDTAHCGDQVTMDVINFSKDPVIVSHSNARNFVKQIRNKPDEIIKALAKKGGVIGLVSVTAFCQRHQGVRPTLEDFLDMADYILKLVGPDHVGIGLDLSPFKTPESYAILERLYPNIAIPGSFYTRNIFTNKEGKDEVSQVPKITEGLMARGYPDQTIEKILGLNFLRVFKEVWRE